MASNNVTAAKQDDAELQLTEALHHSLKNLQEENNLFPTATSDSINADAEEVMVSYLFSILECEALKDVKNIHHIELSFAGLKDGLDKPLFCAHADDALLKDTDETEEKCTLMQFLNQGESSTTTDFLKPWAHKSMGNEETRKKLLQMSGKYRNDFFFKFLKNQEIQVGVGHDDDPNSTMLRLNAVNGWVGVEDIYKGYKPLKELVSKMKA